MRTVNPFRKMSIEMRWTPDHSVYGMVNGEGDEYIIWLSTEFEDDRKTLKSTLAHELAHIYVYKNYKGKNQFYTHGPRHKSAEAYIFEKFSRYMNSLLSDLFSYGEVDYENDSNSKLSF